jgi:hypothetical protein
MCDFVLSVVTLQFHYHAQTSVLLLAMLVLMFITALSQTITVSSSIPRIVNASISVRELVMCAVVFAEAQPQQCQEFRIPPGGLCTRP